VRIPDRGRQATGTALFREYDEKEAGLSEMLIRLMKERAQLFLRKEACERSINVLVNSDGMVRPWRALHDSV